jgi:hypothetical protein
VNVLRTEKVKEGARMPENQRIAKTLDILLEEANEAKRIGDTQREAADQQELSAHKLQALSAHLKAGVEDIKSDLKDAAEKRAVKK